MTASNPRSSRDALDMARTTDLGTSLGVHDGPGALVVALQAR